MSCSCSSGGKSVVMKADMAQILVLVKEKKSAPNHTIPEGSNISRFFTVLIYPCVV